ncbi:MAG TPA: 3-oxoacyl-ACP reductase FabG [Anaerolineae bacterium]|nr:3-oxoacyl-ACP reductase FabG [Anaerolineae bacterium]
MLEGKVALVTGASRGIGAGTALVLARYGADVAVNYLRSRERAEEVCERIRGLGRRAELVQADVTDAQAITRMVAEVEQTLGPIDILVNNAGHNPLRSILEISEEDWDWVLNLNLKSYFLCTKAVLPGMVERGEGRIINVTSISGQRGGLSCDVDYSAAKAGIMGFTRALARWAAPQGVLVNAIAPGYIETEHLRQRTSPDRLARLRETIPLQRLGTPEEIGEVVAFLAGPGGSYIVGEVISVNGGVHIA